MSTEKRPQWTPMANAPTEAECQTCGTQVTRQFARVFGDNRDIVHACPDCATYREMHTDGGSANVGGDDQ